MTGPGDELAELLWDHGPALRRAPPPLFQPFTCSAAGSSRSHELKRHDADATRAAAFGTPVPLALGMRGLGVHHHHHHDDVDPVPWLHCPVVVDDGGDADTAPLPAEYCAAAGLLLSEYSGSAASHAAVAVAVPAEPPTTTTEAAVANKHAGGGGGGEGVVNFTFFSRPLQRPQAASAAASHAVESTVIQAATNRLRSTPLFSEQRMAWLQPPKAPAPAPAQRTTAAAPPPAPLQAPLLSADDNRHGETVVAVAAAQQPRSSQPQPEATRPPDAAAAAAVTTSSVCSGNGDRSQLKRSSCHFAAAAADCSVSPDEDLDDEPGAARRSAARSNKRGRTAEVHNLSERRRRDRINEKMRALQELIPNCNKIDKASMLEEAIEYLKTLQLQVQMMSMGTAAGLCMPAGPAAAAMMLPSAAMHHHLQALYHHHPMAHAHFPHLGMGLGFGMGAAGAHFPMAMPGAAMFGVPPPPGQGVPAAFAHMAGFGCVGTTTAPAAGAGADAVAPPARPGEAEHPPLPGAAQLQGDQAEAPQHPKQT